MTFFIPKILGVSSYSYWQLYIFYLSYVGFFHFGIIDGLYLKIGGKEYDELDKGAIKGQFSFLLLFETVVAFLVILFANYFVNDLTKSIILMLVSISGVITILRSFVLYLLQATNRIKEYSKLTKIDRYIYFALSMLYVILGGRSFVILIILDIISRTIVLYFSIKSVSDIFSYQISSATQIKKELIENLLIGIKLMFGNIAGQLILGVIKFSIEKNWSVSVFGQLSLTLSISNMILVFVSSVSVVMFPLLRRTEVSTLPKLYISLRRIMVFVCYFLLILYPIAANFLLIFLPNYKQSIYFMSIIFPIFIFESRMSLINMTFMKTLREEKNILLLNISTLVLSVFLTMVTVFLLDDLSLTIYVIVFVLATRAFLADLLVSKTLSVKIYLDILIEILLTITFIYSNLNDIFFLYVILFTITILFNLKNIRHDLSFFYIKLFK